MCDGPRTISIPSSIYPNGMYCMGGGHGVAEHGVLSIGCNLVPRYSTKGLQWEMTIDEGSLCKAICFSTSSLVSCQEDFIVDLFSVKSNTTNGTKPDRLPIKDNEWYCALEDTDIVRNNAQDIPISGNCNLYYTVSSEEETPEPTVLAESSLPTEAVTTCNSVCLSTTTPSNKIRYKNVTIFTKNGTIAVREECPVCALTQWNVTLPVPVNEPLPLCNLTVIGINKWQVEKSGGSEVGCSAECFCVHTPALEHEHSCKD